MAEPDETAARIRANYEGYDEDRRLADPFGRLEELHSREVIARHLGPAPQVVCDLGGGTGPYAFWLAGLGHRVHLSDPVPRHIGVARLRNTGGLLASAEVFDARSTGYPSGFADAAVVNGPLYHLVDQAARSAVLTEMRRNLDGRVRTFLEARFHTAAEAEAECRAAGFTPEATVGLVGPAWMVPDLGAALDEPGRRERLMETARLMEAHPDHAPKFVVVCRNPA